MGDEAEFNKRTAREFIVEYERETRQLYQFERLGQPFPDAVVKASDGSEVGIEFVSIVLAFINREHKYFERYRRAFMEAIQGQRPRYAGVRIKLQPHNQFVEQERPILLPELRDPEGCQLGADFARLLDDRFEDLSTVWGGKAGGALLEQLQDPHGKLCYPVLSRYFGAIMIHHMTESEVWASKTSPVDPVIENPVIWYDRSEIPTAVLRALELKAAKGPAYSADFLVLHTLPKDGVPDESGIGMNIAELTQLGRTLLDAATPELRRRFREIWLLNRYVTDGKRLYRLD